jgi:phenylpropionate dioxygenase-like ring-hydroxylating dioxygenase large terminal subunit
MDGMASEDLKTLVNWPGQGVHQVPYRVYTDPDIYAAEQQRLFRGPVWSFVGIEAEVPDAGCYVTRYIGDTAVVMVRDTDGSINVVANRCAHRGNLVCTQTCGKVEHFTCVYHNWIYDLKGKLTSVAFRRGVGGKGGMPEDFDMTEHNMPALRAETYCGMVFATFDKTAPALADYLGDEMRDNIERVVGRKMVLLGAYSQYMPNNWKLYMENVRDSYHASLLHMFQASFGINRLTMDGGIRLSDDGWHHVSYSKEATDKDGESVYSGKNLHAMEHGFQLADPSLIDRWPEYECGTTLAIQSVFPNFVVQQIYNSIALRLCIPKGPEECELLWWIMGTEDDTPEQHEIRLRQANLIGPGGLISMEDGVVGGWVQRATKSDGDELTVLEMGGRDVAPAPGARATETSIRGFWTGWRTAMGV